MKGDGIYISPTEFVSFASGRSMGSLTKMFASRKRTWDVEGALSYYLPDPDPVLRKQGQDVRIYEELLTDAHVGSVADSRKAGVLTQEWKIERGKANRRRHAFIESVFEGLDVHRIITEILDAPLFGYKPLEIIWERRDGLIAPGDVVGKPPEWFRFSSENELLFISKENTNGEPVPPFKFLLAQNDPSYKNPYGKRVLARCFWPVTFKRGGYKFWAMFLEKYGMPLLVGTYPNGTDDDKINEMLGMLENMIQDAVAVIPEGAQVDTVEPSTSGGTRSYREFLAFSNMEISKAVLGQTLTTEMQSSGSYAAAQTHFAVRKEIVENDRKIVQETMNGLISFLFELNFGADEPKPVFNLYEEKEVQKERAERDEILSRTGIRFTKEYYMREYDLRNEDFDLVKTGKGDHREFTETRSQKALSKFEDALGEMGEELQGQAEDALDAIFSLAEESGSFGEFRDQLAEIYPGLDTESFSEELERAGFVAQVWGDMNADD